MDNGNIDTYPEFAPLILFMYYIFMLTYTIFPFGYESCYMIFSVIIFHRPFDPLKYRV
jgi:hypothetical protein